MKITLYKTMTCPYCHMETDWLRDNKVDFTEVYVDQDTEKATELVHKSGQLGVPVTEITGEDGTNEYVLGFNRDQLSKLLKLAA